MINDGYSFGGFAAPPINRAPPPPPQFQFFQQPSFSSFGHPNEDAGKPIALTGGENWVELGPWEWGSNPLVTAKELWAKLGIPPREEPTRCDSSLQPGYCLFFFPNAGFADWFVQEWNSWPRSTLGDMTATHCLSAVQLRMRGAASGSAPMREVPRWTQGGMWHAGM